MFIVYMLNFIDRQLLSILAEDIKATLRLTDAQLGFLYGTSFAIFYAIFGIPLGRLADTWRRGRLMALGLGLWSAMTAISGLATSYLQLAIARIGVGIGEASASPAAFSMLADLFPKKRRALVMAIYSAGLYLGMGLSLPIGGWIAEKWDRSFPAHRAPLGLAGWQTAFLAVGAPGLILALVVAGLREPLRGASEGEGEPIARPGAWAAFAEELAAMVPPISFWVLRRLTGALCWNLVGGALICALAWLLIAISGDRAQWIAYAIGVYAIASWIQTVRRSDPPTYKLIWRTPAVVLSVFGFGGLAFFIYAFGFWAAPFAIRTFHIAKDLAGTYIGVPAAVASALGVIAGGRLSDWWKMRDPRGRIFVGMLSAAMPAPFVYVMFTTNDFGVYATLSPCVYFLSTMWVGSAVAAYQDFVLPRMRGVVGATYVLGSTMVGLALGPYATGKIATVTGSLRIGVLSVLFVTPATLLALWLVSRIAHRTETTKLARAVEAGEPAGALSDQMH